MLQMTHMDVGDSGYSVSFSNNQLPTKAPTLEMIQRLQVDLSNLPQRETGLNHYFSTGLYTRECTIPAGTVVVGKLHRHDHPVMLMKGTATIATDTGVETITGPRVWTSPAGAKRALYTHDDCVFVTVHASHETNLDALEAELIVPENLLSDDSEQSFLTDAVQGVYA